MTINMDGLSHVEIIRSRPAMYVGDVHNSTGPHHMLLEVLANSIDEHLAGRCTCVEVTMHADGSLSVSDDGAGISLEADETGVSWLESVLTTLHQTPTADGHAPHVHLRTSHIGLCMVSALSSSLSADSSVARRRLRAFGRFRPSAKRFTSSKAKCSPSWP